MSVLSLQSIRLLRDDWGGTYGAKNLAEELYAIFNAREPQTTTQPIKMNTDPGVTPLQFGNFTLGDSVINFTGPQGQPVGSLDLGLGGLSFILPNGQPATTPTPVPVSSGGGGIPCQIVSGGPGNGPYVATLYPAGLSGATITANVYQLNIDSTDTIPAGSWGHAFKQTDGQYTIQFPVWL